MNVTLLTWRIPVMDTAAVEAATLPMPALHDARVRLDVPHLAYMATCQRVMWVFAQPPPDAARALAETYRALWGRTVPLPDRFDGADALAHLARVASSLDSLVPGEPQILGQVRDAMRQADGARLLGPDLRRLFDSALHTAKEVRSRTTLFRGHVSLLPLADEAVTAALSRADEARPAVAILGTGVTGQQALRLVRRRCPEADLHIVSRDPDRAAWHARTHNATGHTLSEFLTDPPRDLCLLLAALPTERPFLSAETLGSWAALHPLTVVDLALPRNTARPAASLPGLHLVQMDDMTDRRHEHLAARRVAYDDACRILDDAIQRQTAIVQRRTHAKTLQQLTNRFQDIAEERWRHMDTAAPQAEPDVRKWYDQTVRALLHEAIQTVTAEDDP